MAENFELRQIKVNPSNVVCSRIRGSSEFNLVAMVTEQGRAVPYYGVGRMSWEAAKEYLPQGHFGKGPFVYSRTVFNSERCAFGNHEAALETAEEGIYVWTKEPVSYKRSPKPQYSLRDKIVGWLQSIRRPINV